MSVTNHTLFGFMVLYLLLISYDFDVFRRISYIYIYNFYRSQINNRTPQESPHSTMFQRGRRGRHRMVVGF
jgi:hypothetical protein